MKNNVMKGLKKTWLKGMEVVGNAASNIADNAKYKVSEMNLETRRREILADFGSVAYEMWQRGEVFPPALEAQLEQLNALDEQLTAIRAQRFAAAQEAKLAREAAEEAARKAVTLEQAAEGTDAVEVWEPASQEAPARQAKKPVQPKAHKAVTPEEVLQDADEAESDGPSTQEAAAPGEESVLQDQPEENQ
jgi:hypothetical protein